jgi:D-3-phosphoglycerate dehydrogenase
VIKNKLLSTTEAAEFLGKSVVTMRRWDKSGVLKSQRNSAESHRRYDKQDLIKFLKLREKPKLNHLVNTFIFDFDSTLFPEESLDEVLKLSLKENPQKKEKSRKIEDICRAGMEGEISFEASLAQRFAITELHQRDIQKYLEKCPQVSSEMKRCVSFLKKKGQRVLVISGGFNCWILPLAKTAGIREEFIFTNRFLFDNQGFVTGFMTQNPLARSGGKSELIAQLRSSGAIVGTTVMIGDGASDLEVFKAGQADLFLGFGVYQNRPNVQVATPYFFKSVRTFRNFLEKTLLSRGIFAK